MNGPTFLSYSKKEVYMDKLKYTPKFLIIVKRNECPMPIKNKKEAVR